MCVCVAKPVAVELRCHATALILPPTLKKLMGHIAFGACVRACVTLFVSTVTFKPLKLES